MRIWNKTKSIKKLAILVLTIFLATYVGVFFMSMNMDSNMHENCPFMVGTSICNMTIIDHSSLATTIFTALPQINSFLFLSLIVLGFLSLVFFIPKLFAPPPLKFKPFNISIYSTLHNYLQEAFSNGILNPKTF